MSIQMARAFLLWSTVIDYGLLLWWLLLFAVAHEWLHQYIARWFRLSIEQFDAINYAGIVIFKIGIILFNLIPYVALRIVG